jgi:hypothetical protein
VVGGVALGPPADGTHLLAGQPHLSLVEPTGVLGLAAAYRGRVDTRGRPVGVILSGGNADIPAVVKLMWGARGLLREPEAMDEVREARIGPQRHGVGIDVEEGQAPGPLLVGFL